MDKLEEIIIPYLEALRRQVHADFSAFACQEAGLSTIRWKYAVGNISERFRRIILRSGKGIAGKVVMSGRPMILVNYQPKQYDDPGEYPILYAESLQSALGVPIIIDKRVIGVLLAGYRSPCEIADEVMTIAQQIASEMENILQTEN